jgi:Uri superfamily endonuclease
MSCDTAFREHIHALLPEAMLVPPGNGEAAPAGKGAYALLIRLDTPVPFARGGGTAVIAPGWYVYAGSANGPGGIRARLGHHLRGHKRPHWHVDHLTNAAAWVEALALPGGSECAIVARLVEAAALTLPLAGFGSSDCRACVSHLLRWAGPA